MPEKRISITANLDSAYRVEADLGGHKMVIDQPEANGGTNAGPNPLESFFFALAGCIATIARIAAHQQRINLRGMSLTVEGSLNPAGLMGKPSADRNGFQSIQISAAIDADLDEEQKKRFLEDVCNRCPLHDNVRLETQITHQLLEPGRTA